MSKKYNISAVLAANRNPDLLKKFLRYFEGEFSDIPLVVSCLQASEEIEQILETYKETLNLKVVRGNPKDGHRVSFSELYNAGINAVETEKLVLIHNDMVFERDFFANLDKDITNSSFIEYCIIEPETCLGDRRPGKFICNLGTSFENFNGQGFVEACSNIRHGINFEPGRGFFLAGTKKSFEDIKGFDQITFDPIFCEDDDFCLRVILNGYKILVDRNAIVYHFGSQTSRTLHKEISQTEIESNRKFASKWGFESRVLNESGYEHQTNLLIRKWKFAQNGLEGELLDYFNSITGGNCTSPNAIVGKLDEGTINIHTFLKVLGQIGMLQSLPKPGKYFFEGFSVEIVSWPEDFRGDSRNYLLLQRQTEYE